MGWIEHGDASYIEKKNIRIAELEAQLTAMAVDRNLWQDEHNGDCPNKVLLDTAKRGWDSCVINLRPRRKGAAVNKILLTILWLCLVLALAADGCEPFVHGPREDRIMAGYITHSKWLVPPKPKAICSTGEYAICVNDAGTWVDGKLFSTASQFEVHNCWFEGGPYHWKIIDYGAPCTVDGKHVTRGVQP